MALPKDPTAKTSAAAPPPKKPPVPVVDASTFKDKMTPDPSALWGKPVTVTSPASPPPKKPPTVATGESTPGLPSNVRVSSPAQAIANLRIPDVSDEALIAAFKDKPLYVLNRVNWSKLKSPDRKRLENLINKDSGLKKILDYVLPVYPPANPQTQPQPQPTTAAQVIPEYKIPLEEKPAPKTPLGPDNAKFIENWLNGIKPGFYEYLAAKAKADPEKSKAATDRRAFTDNFLTYFAMYRSQLPEILLDELGKSLLWGALGPVGDTWEKYYYWDMQRKVKWMKNPLNPNALYYWLNSLPTQKAFKVAFIPFKAAWGIFARGNAPLFTKAVYQYVERNPYSLDYGKEKLKEGYFFSPLLKFSEGTSKLADSLDKTIGGVDPEIINKHFNRVLDDLKQTKKQYLSSRIVSDELTRKNAAIALYKARRNLKNQLNRRDGKFLQSWFKPLKKNLSRRLRHVSRDPINGLLALLAGSIMDIVIGIGVNFVRTAVNKVINHIPGLNTLRAQINEFFTSSRWFRIANTTRIGGATIGNFGKALVSPTSFSSGYLGAGAGGWVANVLGLPILPGQIIGGGLGYGLGTFYKTSLNLVSDLRYFNPKGTGWIQQYEAAKPTSLKGWGLDAGAQGEQFIRSHYIEGFRPGPFSRFANWLHNNPFARLPINGFVIADLGVKFLGWNPLVAYPSLIAGDWVWQTRGAWSNAIARWFPTTPLGRWIGNQALSVQTWFTEKIFMRPIAWETGLLGKMPVKWGLRPFWQFMQNTWSKIQPYASTVFNPGFFMGMQFLGSVFMSMGLPWGVAHLVGGLAGAGAWWGVHAIYSAIAGKGAMSLAQWSAAGWVGYFGGLIAQGLLSLLGVHGAWMQFLPMAGSLIATVGVALIPGLGGLLGSFFAGLSTYNIAWALGISSTAYAAGLAIAATIVSIGLVAILTIFSGFVIYSSFWVPLVEESQATPQSTNFSINSACNKLPNDNYQCCSSFDITQPLFNRNNSLAHVFDLSASSLVVQLFDQEKNEDTIEKNTDAFRRVPGETQLALNHIPYPSSFGHNDYSVATTVSIPVLYYSKVESFLSTPSDQRQNLFELMQQDSSVVYSMKPFFDILTSLAKEHGKTEHLIAEYKAQLALMEEQKKLVDDLIPDIEDGKLDKALSVAMGYDPCPDPNQPCPEEKQGLKITVNRYISTIELYLNQTDPNLDNFLASLEQEQEGLKQQIDLLPGIIGQMEKAQDKINSQEKADAILDAKFLSFTSISLEEQEKIWTILKEYLPDIFNKSKTFYFIPKNTNYKVCLETQFRGNAGQLQTVCSTISADQSFWAQTNFAKHCTTFTPQ